MNAEFGIQLSSVFSKIMDKNDYNLKSTRHASEIRYVDYQCTEGPQARTRRRCHTEPQ